MERYPDKADLIEHVQGSSRQRAYWRVKQYTIWNPTPAQARVRLALTEASSRVYDERRRFKGPIPPVAVEVQKAMKGKRFSDRRRERATSTLIKLDRALRKIGERMEAERRYVKVKVKAEA